VSEIWPAARLHCPNFGQFKKLFIQPSAANIQGFTSILQGDVLGHLCDLKSKSYKKDPLKRFFPKNERNIDFSHF
jgi:hypothetical protein